MMALAGYPLGLRFRFLESKSPCPVEEMGELVRADYDDEAALGPFAEGLDVVTYEFENVPVRSATLLEAHLPVHPAPAALRAAQDRLREKQGFESLGIPTAPFHPVESRDGLDEAVGHIGLPAVLKTRRWGYDGKGQEVLERHADLDGAWERLGGQPLLLERFIDFSRELSQVAVRGRDGSVAFYPLVENEHREGILVRTLAPAPVVGDRMRDAARTYVRTLMEDLGYVGVLALELFQEGEHLLANEMAPRVHNSGHWTQDGAWCSQFENHLRAVAGLPLGPTDLRHHAGMRNILGTAPDPADVLRIPGVRLHQYDKAPRPGRKLGHVNVLGSDPSEVMERLERLEDLLTASG
jgi:5-(carboxyamino)imidazole ribonucleotide synthase